MLPAEITKGRRTLGTTARSGLLATPSAVGEFNYSMLPLLGLGSQGTLQQLMNKASQYLYISLALHVGKQKHKNIGRHI